MGARVRKRNRATEEQSCGLLRHSPKGACDCDRLLYGGPKKASPKRLAFCLVYACLK